LRFLREGVWFYIGFSSFLLYRNRKRLREFEEIETLGKAVEVTVNNKEENSSVFCLDFVEEFGLRTTKRHLKTLSSGGKFKVVLFGNSSSVLFKQTCCVRGYRILKNRNLQQLVFAWIRQLLCYVFFHAQSFRNMDGPPADTVEKITELIADKENLAKYRYIQYKDV
jgi:hypothetical protein